MLLKRAVGYMDLFIQQSTVGFPSSSLATLKAECDSNEFESSTLVNPPNAASEITAQASPKQEFKGSFK